MFESPEGESDSSKKNLSKTHPEAQSQSKHEQLYNPEHDIESFKHLLKQGNPDTSSWEFVQELKSVNIEDEEKNKMRTMGRLIQWQDKKGGIGYSSSSVKHNKSKELLTTAYVANCFIEREISTQPIVTPIDEFYKFIPGNSSLVAKTEIFNKIAKEQNPEENFAIILTDFAESDIFTPEILEQIPNQDNAGLNPMQKSEFGKKLWDFIRQQLPLIIQKEKGNLDAVLKQITGVQDSEEKNAKLLLATGLLLMDIQAWQNLWNESGNEETSLYIVAPMSFHDAMNRINLAWGHGVADYEYRASCSLGSNIRSPFEDINEDEELQSYEKQGLSAEEFKQKIEPLLDMLLN